MLEWASPVVGRPVSSAQKAAASQVAHQGPHAVTPGRGQIGGGHLVDQGAQGGRGHADPVTHHMGEALTWAMAVFVDVARQDSS